MKKAVFLDRDGVINRERGEYTFRVEDLEILPDVSETLKILQAKGYLLIIITNQGGIAKGLYSGKEVHTLQERIDAELKMNGVEITDWFYCPHHPDHGYCLCRKPESLLFEKALAKWKIDPSTSFMVGDKERDILPAERMGIKGILVPANSSLLPILEEIP